MSEISELTEKIMRFVKERDWDQFENPKDLAISIALEAGEILEHFQWKSKEEIEEYVKTHKDELSEEIADVLIYLLDFSHRLEIDVIDASHKKLAINEKKYPVEKAKGKNLKYDKL